MEINGVTAGTRGARETRPPELLLQPESGTAEGGTSRVVHYGGGGGGGGGGVASASFPGSVSRRESWVVNYERGCSHFRPLQTDG